MELNVPNLKRSTAEKNLLLNLDPDFQLRFKSIRIRDDNGINRMVSVLISVQNLRDSNLVSDLFLIRY